MMSGVGNFRVYLMMGGVGGVGIAFVQGRLGKGLLDDGRGWRILFGVQNI